MLDAERQTVYGLYRIRPNGNRPYPEGFIREDLSSMGHVSRVPPHRAPFRAPSIVAAVVPTPFVTFAVIVITIPTAATAGIEQNNIEN